MRWRRWIAGAGMVGLGVVGLALLSTLGFGVFLGTAPGNRWLEARVENAVNLSMDTGSFEIDGLSTNLWSRARIQGLRIADEGGRPLLSLGPTQARFNLSSLLTGPLTVHHLDAIDLQVVLDAGPTGRMALAELFGPPSESTDPFELPIDLDIRELEIEGARLRRGASVDLRGATLMGAVRSDGPRFDVSDLALCAHILAPGPTSACVEGPLIWEAGVASLTELELRAPGTAIDVSGSAGLEALELELKLESVDLEALDPVASHVGITGTYGGALTVAGPVEELAITGSLQGLGSSRGTLGVDARASFGEEISWGGELRAEGVHVEDAYPGTGRPVVLDGVVTLDGTGVRFPDELLLDVGFVGTADVEEGTYILDDSDFSGRIEGGVLTLERGAFVGIAGALDATGTIDLVSGPLELKVTGEIDPAEIAELGIEGLGGRGQADLKITGDLKGDAGRFGVSGQVVMAPFSYTEEVRFERMVADLSGTVEGSDFGFDVWAVGSEGVAYGLAMQSLNAPAVRVLSRDKDLSAVGPARVEGLRYPGLGRFDSADIQFDYRLPVGGEIEVDAGIALGGFDLQTFVGDGGIATVKMMGSEIDYELNLSSWGREFLASRGAYDLGTGRLEAPLFRVAPTARLAWASRGLLALTVVEGGVRDAEVVLKSVHGDVVVRGDLVTAGLVDGTVSLGSFQLDALAELFPADFPGLSGVLDLDADLTGPASDPVVTGNLDLEGFWLEEVARWLDVSGGYALRGGELEVELDIGSAGEALAQATGRIPVHPDLADPGLNPDGEVAVSVVLRPGSLARIEYITPTELGLVPGEISAVVDLSGRLGDPDIRASGIVQTAVGNWVDPGRLEFDLRRTGDELDGWASLREGLSERVALRGGGTTRMERVFAAYLSGGEEVDTSDLELWVDNMAVSAVVSGLPAESAMGAVELGIVARGELVGGFTAAGSPYTPEIQGGLHWFEPGIGNEDLEHASFTVVPLEGGAGLVLDGSVGFQEGGLAVSGPIPIAIDLRKPSTEWSAGELDLEISGKGVPIGLLSILDRGIVDGEGLAAIEGEVHGSFADPIPELTASIRDGGLTYLPMGVRVSKINADLEAGERRVKLSRFVARTAPLNQVGFLDEARPSRVSITGAANIEEGMLSTMSARIENQDAWVMGTYDAALRLNGALLVSGAWPHLNVVGQGGDLELVAGRFIYNSDSAEVAGPLQPSETLIIHRGGERRRTERLVEAPFYAGFNVDLGVDLNRNLEVIATIPFFDDLGAITASLTQASVSSRLGGVLDIALDADGNPVLTGEVDVVDGSVRVLRTQFALDEGRVVLLGGDVGGTQLDVTGSTYIEGTPVELKITGTADEPKLKTTAVGYDDTQVLVMLLTGRAPDSLSGDESRTASGQATLMAAGTAAALFAGSVFSGAATGALTIEPDGGIRVGAPWSASVLTQLVLKPLAAPNENLVAFSLEWTVARRLLLEFGAGTTFQWTDFSWETRF